MEQPRLAFPRTIVAVSIVGFGIRDRIDRHRSAIRKVMFEIMPQAFRQAGIPWDSESSSEDRGDGLIILVKPEVPKSLFVESLPTALINAIHVYNSSHSYIERIRLQMALHAGEVYFDSHGTVGGSSINLTFNLLDSDTVRNAIIISPGALAIVASTWFYKEIVRHSMVATAYQPFEIGFRGTRGTATTTITGWICLPDHVNPEHTAAQPDDQADLFLRVYIPSERLYAAEAEKLLSLFRDWFMAVRGPGIRQSGHSTASGQMYEFFIDASMAKMDLRDEFNSFSSFLTLCSADPSAAADMLVPMGLKRDISADFVARFNREVRRLQIDLTHERERRILAIRHNLEEELVDHGVELRAIPSAQINALIETLVPGPSASDSLMLLTGPQSASRRPPVAVNINQQFINAIESTIIQNVRGTVHLGPKAREILALIDRFGGQETPLLEAAVHELEDMDARPADRSAARRLLKKFLGQIAGTVHDVGLDLLEKYLESKIGI
jgi:hypothetical protein